MYEKADSDNQNCTAIHQKTGIDKFTKNGADVNKWPKSWTTTYYKQYPRFEEIHLPRKLVMPPTSLLEALYERKSIRNFSSIPMDLQTLSTLLYFTGGVRGGIGHIANESRFYPSAGARYPIEIYPIIMNSSDVNPGIYHYNLKHHSIEFLWSMSQLKQELKRIMGQGWIKNTSTIIVLTAVFARSEMKYGSRAYRYICFEGGHIGQNIYLLSTGLNIRCCAIGGYIDGRINALLDLDTSRESVICLYALGK